MFDFVLFSRELISDFLFVWGFWGMWLTLWQITSSGCSVEMDGEWESRLVSEGLYKESAIWSPCWHLSTPLKTVNHVHSSTLASLQIKTTPCAAISRKAGVEATCRMQTIVYGSLQLSCSNKGSRENNKSSPWSCKFHSTHSSKHTLVYCSHRLGNTMLPCRIL